MLDKYDSPELHQLPSLLILDRDGVILKHRDPYILKSSDVEFVSGSLQAIEYVAKLGIRLGVVSNQSPINRKLITSEFVEQTNYWIKEKLSLTNNQLKFYFCPHLPEDGCYCRKPQPGMLEQAMNDFNVLPETCWLVGDHDTDMKAAKNASIDKRFHLLSGRQEIVSPYATRTYKNLHHFIISYIGKYYHKNNLRGGTHGIN